MSEEELACSRCKGRHSRNEEAKHLSGRHQGWACLPLERNLYGSSLRADTCKHYLRSDFHKPVGIFYIHMADEDAIPFEGSLETSCPITLAPFSQISCPIAFRNAPHQPYEAAALAEWLSVRKTNPLTNMPCQWENSPFEILVPLLSSYGTSSARRVMEFFMQHLQQSDGNVFDQVSKPAQIWANSWHPKVRLLTVAVTKTSAYICKINRKVPFHATWI